MRTRVLRLVSLAQWLERWDALRIERHDKQFTGSAMLSSVLYAVTKREKRSTSAMR